MPGVRGPQPPATGPPANFSRTRRRNSLPALSSAQLNRLSANASKTKTTSQENKNGVSKSPPEENSQKAEKRINEKSRSSSINPNKPLKPVGKDALSKDLQVDENANECNGENNYSSLGTKDDDVISPVLSGSSILQKKVQSRTNAVFIFRFEDDDNKPNEKETKSSDDNSLSRFPINKSPSPKPLSESPDFKSELSNTWPPESFDINSFNLLKSVRYNTLSFCGHKHKQFRDSRKLCHIMSPVQELKTPVDDTEYEMEDEWSTSSSSEHWTDTRSSNGRTSPGIFRGRDEMRKKGRPVKINANSNLMLRRESDSNLSSNLRSALSLSPRRNSYTNSRNVLSTPRTVNSKSKDKSSQSLSSQRLRNDSKGGVLESKVGQIFNSLRSTDNTTSKQSNTMASVDDHEAISRTQLPPRLQARRRSLSALPDLVKMKGATSGLVKR